MDCPKDCKFTHNVNKQHLLHHVRNGIPTIITHKQTHLLPTRDDFVDPTLKKSFALQLQKNRPVLFLPTTYYERNEYVDGTPIYRIYLFGILPDGSKTCVVLQDIDVYFDILVPEEFSTASAFDAYLREELFKNRLFFKNIETVEQYPMQGFSPDKKPYKRIFFNNLKERTVVMSWVDKQNDARKRMGKPTWQTAADDREGNYFNKVAREAKFKTANWNRIEDYIVIESPTTGYTLTAGCTYTLKVSLKNFQKLTKKRKAELMQNKTLASFIEKDRTMINMWDIETYRTIQAGGVPTPEDTDFTIFMMCCSYFWHYTDKPLLSVCVVDQPSTARPGMDVVIVCGEEKNVLSAYMRVVGKMRPDINGAFNGGNFDWPLYRAKCHRANLMVDLKSEFSSMPVNYKGKWADTNDSVLKWNFGKKEIKIDAETNHVLACVANFPGMLDVDVMPIFLKMYPKLEVGKAQSLNFFLAKNDIESKEDMDFKRMFRIYERSVKLNGVEKCHCSLISQTDESNESNHYHDINCSTCKEFVRDLDYVAVDSSVKLSERQYTDVLVPELLRDGKSVCCYCGKKQEVIKHMEDVGYYCIIDCVRPQQLFVKRSIVSDKRALSCMSYVSLYDSFFHADGMKVRNLMGANAIKFDIAFSNANSRKSDSEKEHYPGAWVFPPNRGLNNRRPITGLDFASLYPSLMMAYNISPNMVVESVEEKEKLEAMGYTLQHIGPFDYEVGPEKGLATNRKCTKEGWVVRHNGVFDPRKNTKIISRYRKVNRYEFKIRAEDGSIKTQVVDVGVADAIKDEIDMYNDCVRDTNTVPTPKTVFVPIYGRDRLPNEQMGISAYVVKKIFDKRVPVKAEFVKLSKLKEQMEAAKPPLTEIQVTLPNGETAMWSFEDVCFKLAVVEAEQKALKIFANTTYGEMGNFRSSLYALLVAAGITTKGQYNIKAVNGFVSGKGFNTEYGDTDSLYLTCPDRYYVDVDRVYEEEVAGIQAGEFDILVECARYEAELPQKRDEGLQVLSKKLEANKIKEADYQRQCKKLHDTCDAKLAEFVAIKTESGATLNFIKNRLLVESRIKYWTGMVSITMRVMSQLQREVAEFLLGDNGTQFLNMAYEEVGFPTVLTGKKKYYMTPHVETINFYPHEIFIRGIDIIKQGQSQLAKDLGNEFMRESLSPENNKELIDLAIEKVSKVYKAPWDVKYFTLTARYRPSKKNVPVQTFVARMRQMEKMYHSDPIMAALYKPPEADDKFAYVIVKKGLRYNITGSKIALTKGDKMEYLRVYLASQSTDNPMEIDLDYYVQGSIIGLFARFIAYHPNFQPPAGTYNTQDKDEYKEMDKWCVNEATKFLENLCNRLSGVNPDDARKIGRDYQQVYRTANKAIKRDMRLRYGASAELFMIKLDEESEDGNIAAQIKSKGSKIVDQSKSIAEINSNINPTSPEDALDFIMKSRQMSVFDVRRVYNSQKGFNLFNYKIEFLKRKEQNIVDAMYKIAPTVAKMLTRHERSLVRLIDDLRKDVNNINITDDDLNNINNFPDEDVTDFNTYFKLLNELTAVIGMKKYVAGFKHAIESRRDKEIGYTEPKIDSVEFAKDIAVKTQVLPDYEWK